MLCRYLTTEGQMWIWQFKASGRLNVQQEQLLLVFKWAEDNSTMCLLLVIKNCSYCKRMITRQGQFFVSIYEQNSTQDWDSQILSTFFLSPPSKPKVCTCSPTAMLTPHYVLYWFLVLTSSIFTVIIPLRIKCKFHPLMYSCKLWIPTFILARWIDSTKVKERT
jgi:hypothetical protein